MLYQATIDPAASQLRLEFLRIVCSHEHYVTLNLPFPTPLYPSPPPSPTNSVSSIGSAMSSYTVIIGNSMAELSTAFRQQHFLAGLILSELALALEGGWVILLHSIWLEVLVSGHLLTREGRALPYRSHIYMCHPQRVGFLRRFGLKVGIDFAHLGLKSGTVLEGTRKNV